jgi:hypothetical protein
MLNEVKLAVKRVLFEDKDSVLQFRKFGSRGGSSVFIDDKENVCVQEVERSVILTYMHGKQWFNEKRFKFTLPEKLRNRLYTILEKTDFFTLSLNKQNKNTKEKNLIRISIRLKDSRENTIADFSKTNNKEFLKIYNWFKLLRKYAKESIDPIYEGEHKQEWITDSLKD